MFSHERKFNRCGTCSINNKSDDNPRTWLINQGSDYPDTRQSTNSIRFQIRRANAINLISVYANLNYISYPLHSICDTCQRLKHFLPRPIHSRHPTFYPRRSSPSFSTLSSSQNNFFSFLSFSFSTKRSKFASSGTNAFPW